MSGKLSRIVRIDLRQTTVPEEFHNATVPSGFSVLAADVQNLAISNQCACRWSEEVRTFQNGTSMGQDLPPFQLSKDQP